MVATLSGGLLQVINVSERQHNRAINCAPTGRSDRAVNCAPTGDLCRSERSTRFKGWRAAPLLVVLLEFQVILDTFDLVFGVMVHIEHRGFARFADLLDQRQHQLTVHIIKAQAGLIKN